MAKPDISSCSPREALYRAEMQGYSTAVKLEAANSKPGAVEEWFETHPNFGSANVRALISRGEELVIERVIDLILRRPNRAALIIQTPKSWHIIQGRRE